jgi:hypothetical protein
VKYCVITGAADGIGSALAHCCAAKGYTIVGIDIDVAQAARTQAALEQSGARVSFIHADLASAVDIEHTLDILSTGPQIDLFIHNAGINQAGRFEGSNLEQQQRVIDVNLLAPLLLTAGLLERERLAQSGALVFLSSLSRFVGYPGAAVYAASKDGLASYARSLSVSLAAQDIHVLTVYPGPTRTAHARRYSPNNSREERRMPPETLAAEIMHALEQRQRFLIAGRGNRLFALIGRYMPRMADRVMRKLILEKFDRQHTASEV